MNQRLPQIQSLIIRHLEGRLSASDRLVLEDWKGARPENRRLFEELTSGETLQQQLYRLREIDVEAALGRFNAREYNAKTVLPRRWLRGWSWAAAFLVLALGIGYYAWKLNKEQLPAAVPATTDAGIPPGKSGAILTLADGSQVVLDDLDNGVIANQNGSRVVLQNGRLAYDRTELVSSEITYNTMSTPKGRQFRLVLPDGTKVWLNAASSVRYPTAFSGNQRRVYVKGEAYFEVAKNTERPFSLIVNDRAEIGVLGTSFNVNAYENEKGIYTTLLEGSISMAAASGLLLANGQEPSEKAKHAVIVRPGQQAQIAYLPDGSEGGEEIKIIDNADMERVTAWKNGLFNFNGVSLKDAMRQLERWYDIEVLYEKGVPDIKFWGEMSRGVTLDGLIAALRQSEVHFTIEGKKLRVRK